MPGRPVPTEVEGELVELTRVALDERRAEWDLLCAKAKELGYKPGWAYYRYKERYGSPPPRSFSLPKSGTDKAATETEKRAYFDHLSTIARERGYRRGYVIVRYRDKFGAPPPAHFDNEAPYSVPVQWGPQ